MKKTLTDEVSSCEIGAPRRKGRQIRKASRCAFYSHRGDFSWKGIKDEAYKPEAGGWKEITRRVLIGTHGESTKFHLRYFEISPGGNSSFERHRHEHAVICVRGQGILRTGSKKRRLGFMDTAYVSPGTPHQLLNPFEEPFGFLCVVDSERDRPELL